MASAQSSVERAKVAVSVAFIAAGFAFASWASRIPQIRDQLGLDPGQLGLLLLALAIGSLVALPLAGIAVARFGEARVVGGMSVLGALGLATIALGYRHGWEPVAVGLVLSGFGFGMWDVAMNVHGAFVEQRLGRSIMSRLHAGFSIGTVAGSGVGAAMVALGVGVTVHLILVAVVVGAGLPIVVRRGFLVHGGGAAGGAAGGAGGAAGGAVGGAAGGGVGGAAGGGVVKSGTARSDVPIPKRQGSFVAWTEPRTLMLGVFVLCMAFAEGTGNDWLAVATIDGYDASAAVGTITFAIFLSAMTAGRWFGPPLIDRYGRVAVLRGGAAVAAVGLLLVTFGSALPVAMVGAAVWGLGTSMGFPTGMSAAADDTAHAAARVSVVSSIGYVAFLAGPPLLGVIGDRVGTLHSLATAVALLVLAAVIAGVAKPLEPAGAPAVAR